jgi:hypothetical protein
MSIPIDKMTNTDFEKYWLDKDGTVLTRSGRTGTTFTRCRDIVRAFLDNPANRDLMATCRQGMAIKACTAVAEGEVLTRDLWLSLAGYGKEIESSAKAHA